LREQNIETIRAACIKANPHKFGDGTREHPHIDPTGEVRLADVLLTLSKTRNGDMMYGVKANGALLTDFCERTAWSDDGDTPILWELRADTLDEQSDERAAYIATLLRI
jgi:hypothetical protein